MSQQPLNTMVDETAQQSLVPDIGIFVNSSGELNINFKEGLDIYKALGLLKSAELLISSSLKPTS